MKGVELRTERLVLREFRLEDEAAVHQYGSDEEVMRYTTWGHNSSAENVWLLSRTADCPSVSSVYQGGTLAPVQYGLCEVSETQARSAMLHSYFDLLEQGTTPKPAWP